MHSPNCSTKFTFHFSYNPSFQEILTKQLGIPQYIEFTDYFYDTNDYQFIKSNIWLKQRVNNEGQATYCRKEIIKENNFQQQQQDFILKFKEFTGDEIKESIRNNSLVSKKIGFTTFRYIFLSNNNIDNNNSCNSCEIYLDEVTFEHGHTLYVGSVKSTIKEDIERLLNESCFKELKLNACRSAVVEYIRMYENNLYKDLMQLGHVSKEEEQLKRSLYSDYDENELKHLDLYAKAFVKMNVSLFSDQLTRKKVD